MESKPALAPPPAHTLFSMLTLGEESTPLSGESEPRYYRILVLESDAAETGGPTWLAVHFSSPGRLVAATPLPTAQGKIIAFSDDFFCLTGDDKDLLLGFELFQAGITQRPLLVSGEQQPEVMFLLDRLAQEFAGASLLRNTLLRAYLKVFLVQCVRLQQAQAGSESSVAQPGLFTRFQALLEQQYTEAKTVQEYAQQLHVTANHLSETIKKETGLPASDHIRHRITLEAQRLAYFTDLSLKEIAHRLGYEDVAHFSRFFKRYNGVGFLKFKDLTRQE